LRGGEKSYPNESWEGRLRKRKGERNTFLVMIPSVQSVVKARRISPIFLLSAETEKKKREKRGRLFIAAFRASGTLYHKEGAKGKKRGALFFSIRMGNDLSDKRCGKKGREEKKTKLGRISAKFPAVLSRNLSGGGGEKGKRCISQLYDAGKKKKKNEGLNPYFVPEGPGNRGGEKGTTSRGGRGLFHLFGASNEENGEGEGGFRLVFSTQPALRAEGGRK